jgi:G6PDH family F420-dependent oxidoreductase
VPELGYALSSEEHGPDVLVDNAVRAEAVGFEHALVSDHYHPWVPTQGEAPFVWTTLGGIARETESIHVGTGVTAPIIRIHPANVAQATATTAAMFDGRFFFGVGTGEHLNEHVTGQRWPEFDVRMQMLEEAVALIRRLWTGENVSHHGEHYTVENAKLFTLPETPPEVCVSGTGPKSARKAGEFGDGLVSTAPVAEFVDGFHEEGDGPRYGQATVCYAESKEEAIETALEYWPNSAIPGEVSWELPTPKHFEAAAEDVGAEDVQENIVCGPDPDDHLDQLQEFVDAGFDHVYVHQVGPNQEEFFEFYESEILPSFG